MPAVAARLRARRQRRLPGVPLGEHDAAFEWLERAVVQRDHGLIWVRKDRMLLPLHSDPRWKALLEKMNFPTD